MNPIRIEGSDYVAIAPDDVGPELGHISNLLVRTEKVGSYRVMRSAWELGEFELLRLATGAQVHLGVSAPQHPVVQLGVGPTALDGPPAMIVRFIARDDMPQCVRIDMLSPGNSVEGLPTVHGYAEREYEPERLGEIVGELVKSVIAKTSEVHADLRKRRDSR